MFFTIMDADTIVPSLYIDEVDRAIKKEYSDRHSRIFTPPQLYFYNDQEASFLVRSMDNFHSLAHLYQLSNVYGISMPLSNYTLSYNLIKRIGYWDTCADAIGEDYHTTVKAMMKTHGEIKTRKVMVPLNQMCIITGDGFLADYKARFWQGVRHMEGIATFAYFLNNLSTVKFSLRFFGVLVFFLEMIAFGFVIPFLMTAVYCEAVSTFYHTGAIPMFYIWSLIAYSIMGEFSFVIFGLFKQKCVTQVYKQKINLFKMLFEMRCLIMVIAYIFITPMFMVACIRTLRKERVYVRADKKLAGQDSGALVESSLE